MYTPVHCNANEEVGSDEMKRNSLVSLMGPVLLALAWLAVNQFPAATAQGPKESDRQTLVLNRAPVRVIRDQYSSFNGITMDEERREVYIADDNHSKILVYDAEFPPTDRVIEPRRQIAGPQTHLGYICTLAISPEDQEIFTVDNDWKDNMTVFPIDAKGNVAPLRELNVDHGAWGIFLDRKHNELFITIEHAHKISVYSKKAQGKEEPARFIQGPETGLADPHGIYVDPESNEIFVTNHGHWRKTEVGDKGVIVSFRRPTPSDSIKEFPASTGKFLPPSITVYARDAQGDAKPLRTISGPATRMNLPLGIYEVSGSRLLAVANAGDSSILFFDRSASGNTAPVRVIQGPATGIEGPSGVYVDSKRNELWVTNWNSHTATIYPSNASGNVAPKRVLRSAPKGAPVTGFGNPGGIVYDAKRDEMLVPN